MDEFVLVTGYHRKAAIRLLHREAIAEARTKTDKVDSATLAHLLRSDLLPLSYVPERLVRLNRGLLG